jgi:hypothetical protein
MKFYPVNPALSNNTAARRYSWTTAGISSVLNGGRLERRIPRKSVVTPDGERDFPKSSCYVLYIAEAASHNAGKFLFSCLHPVKQR